MFTWLDGKLSPANDIRFYIYKYLTPNNGEGDGIPEMHTVHKDIEDVSTQTVPKHPYSERRAKCVAKKIRFSYNMYSTHSRVTSKSISVLKSFAYFLQLFFFISYIQKVCFFLDWFWWYSVYGFHFWDLLQLNIPNTFRTENEERKENCLFLYFFIVNK